MNQGSSNPNSLNFEPELYCLGQHESVCVAGLLPFRVAASLMRLQIAALGRTCNLTWLLGFLSFYFRVLTTGTKR